MDRTYILFTIYTSENSASHKDTNLCDRIPMCAGTKDSVERELDRHIERAKEQGLLVEEISSKDVHSGSYFDRVVRLQNKIGGPTLFGISSCWTV